VCPQAEHTACQDAQWYHAYGSPSLGRGGMTTCQRVPLGLGHAVRAAVQRCPSPARPGSLRRQGGACFSGAAIAAGAARVPDGIMGGNRDEPPEARPPLPWRRSRPSSGSRLRKIDRQHDYFSYDVRSTSRADTMARRARHSRLLAFPAEAPLTPGTLDPEIALSQRDEMLAKLPILRPEREKLSGQFVYLPHASSIRSCHTRPHTSTTLSTVPQAGGHAAVVVCGPQMARPVHTRHLDRLMPGKR
jgi:hypothetical protein